jgi:hypothetical protein
MDRSIAKRTTLDEQGKDAGMPDATPAERLQMVWPLTVTAWKFKEPNIVQPRLQRQGRHAGTRHRRFCFQSGCAIGGCDLQAIARAWVSVDRPSFECHVA